MVAPAPWSTGCTILHMPLEIYYLYYSVTTRRSEPTSPMMNICVHICIEVSYLLAWSSPRVLVSAGEKQRSMPQPCCCLAAQPTSPRGMGFAPGEKGTHGCPECLGATCPFHRCCNTEPSQQRLKCSSGLQSHPHAYKHQSSVHENPLFAHLWPIYCSTRLNEALDEPGVPSQRADAREKEREEEFGKEQEEVSP